VNFFFIEVAPSLSLRRRTAADAKVFFELIEKNRAHLHRWLDSMPSFATLEETITYFESCDHAFAAEPHLIPIGIYVEDTCVGWMELHSINARHRRASIGYWIDADYAGQRIVSRCVAALVDFAFSQLNLHRLEIHCSEQNHASRKIAQKLGFLEEANRTDRIITTGGSFENEMLYALIAPNSH